MTPVQQLEFIWQPIAEAKLDWQKKGGSRLDMWTSPLLERHCKTLRHLNETELAAGALLIGHEQFRGFELLGEAASLCDGSFFVMPWYLVNYCQDEQRHELHVVGAVLRPDKSLLIVDPNGVVPEDFGVPNVVMVRLPWTVAK